MSDKFVVDKIEPQDAQNLIRLHYTTVHVCQRKNDEMVSLADVAHEIGAVDKMKIKPYDVLLIYGGDIDTPDRSAAHVATNYIDLVANQPEALLFAAQQFLASASKEELPNWMCRKFSEAAAVLSGG